MGRAQMTPEVREALSRLEDVYDELLALRGDFEMIAQTLPLSSGDREAFTDEEWQFSEHIDECLDHCRTMYGLVMGWNNDREKSTVLLFEEYFSKKKFH